MRIWKTITTLAAVAACVATVAQAQGERKSPHETAKATIDGANITVEYGRPVDERPEGHGRAGALRQGLADRR